MTFTQTVNRRFLFLTAQIIETMQNNLVFVTNIKQISHTSEKNKEKRDTQTNLSKATIHCLLKTKRQIIPACCFRTNFITSAFSHPCSFSLLTSAHFISQTSFLSNFRCSPTTVSFLAGSVFLTSCNEGTTKKQENMLSPKVSKVSRERLPSNKGTYI